MPVSPTTLERLRPAARVRLAGEVLAAYVRARWLLRRKTPVEAVADLRRYARRHEVEGEEGTDIVVSWRLARAVVRTLGPLPTDVRCLFRSLTLLTMLERRNISPTLVIGVRPQPFAAHAWVELDGQPLLPPADPDHERLTEL